MDTNKSLVKRGLDRNSEASAQQVVEWALPDPAGREEVLRLFAEAIGRAHAAKDTSWGVTLHVRGVRLNVGTSDVFFIGRQDSAPFCYFIVAEAAIGDEDRKSLEALGVHFAGAYKSSPGSNRAVVPLAHATESIPLLRAAHLRLVEQSAGAVRTKMPWFESHSPGVVKFLNQTLGVDLPTPSYVEPEDSGDKFRSRFRALFEEFKNSFLNTEKAREHFSAYDAQRLEGRENFRAIVERAERGEDVTDDVLLKLLPHNNTDPNRARGAWIHIAPAVTKDVVSWFEGKGWKTEWPQVAEAILRLLRRIDDDPRQIAEACAEFSSLPHSKGFQSGMLSPIMNALRPDECLLINNKSRQAINYFGDTDYSSSLAEYPVLNRTGQELIEELFADIDGSALPANVPEADLFDLFSHWLVAIKKFDFKRDTLTTSPVRYWKVAPGENAWEWDECLKDGYIAIGWSEMGDVTGLDREEFESRRVEVVAEHPEWANFLGAKQVEQLWSFSHDIKVGDRIVANRGTSEVLGIGTVTGPCVYVPGERHAHRLPVTWDDTRPRAIREGNWRSALIELNEAKFETIVKAPYKDGGPVPPPPPENMPFTPRTFELLAGLHEEPKRDYYNEHKDEFEEHLVRPFQELFRHVAARLPTVIREEMETEKKIFGRLLKNDYGHGGAWSFYWGAFYPKGGKRTEDAQLFLWINRERLEAGFYIGEYGSEQRNRFLRNLHEHRPAVTRIVQDHLEDLDLAWGGRGDIVATDADPASGPSATWQEWLSGGGSDAIVPRAALVIPAEKVLGLSGDELEEIISRLFEKLYPLVLLALSDLPMPAISEYLGEGDGGDDEDKNPEYTLAQCAAETGFEVEALEQWILAIERKKQAVLFGPPGTGKTFMAEHLARHLVGGGDGVVELLQFHPATEYEDFMIGIRPRRGADGGLDYPQVQGRFLDFCEKAAKRQGISVLIIDEINRADLARVFGELMFLLEYRDREVRLAGGREFRVPAQVRLIGTMNTADRSVALVDHALRRRFAFLPLYPDYNVLTRYHALSGTDVSGLVETLRELNRKIGDRHYELGPSYFMVPDLPVHLENIWRTEIEPYVEEYFFDRRSHADEFRWEAVKDRVRPRS